MNLVLSRFEAETLESRDGKFRYQEFLLRDVIGRPRGDPYTGTDIETAMVALGLVEGIHVANEAIECGSRPQPSNLPQAVTFITPGNSAAPVDSQTDLPIPTVFMEWHAA